MPTATTLPLILLIALLWRYTKGQTLAIVLFTSIFDAASALDFGQLGIAPWLFTLVVCLGLKVLTGHRPIRFAPHINRVAVVLFGLFFVYCFWTGIAYPVLLHGTPVIPDADIVPLTWSFRNLAQLCYLLAAAVLYSVTVTCTREELRKALDWFLNGCVVASLFAYYQLANAILHIPYPTSVIVSNHHRIIYPAYKIGSMWRLDSTFPEASEMAMYLSIGVAVMVWELLTEPLTTRRLIRFSVVLLALLLTGSSTGYISLVVIVAMGVAFATFTALRQGGLDPARILIGLVLVMAMGLTFATTDAKTAVMKVLKTTILDKSQSSSYKERTSTHATAVQTMKNTYYLGAGWGTVRAWGLFYILMANIGLFGVAIFSGCVASVYLPMLGRGLGARGSPSSGLQAAALLGLGVLLLEMILSGAEPVYPILWALFGITTVGSEAAARVSYRQVRDRNEVAAGRLPMYAKFGATSDSSY